MSPSMSMKLAVLSYSFAHLYNFSPWRSIPFREMCYVLTQYDALHCLPYAAAEREAEMSIEATEKKCEYIVIICDVPGR